MSKAPTAFLRQDIVSARVGLGRHQIRRLEDDGKFPKRVKLGDNSVAWVESEIDEWMQSRIAERDRSNTSSSKAKNAQPLERPGVL